MVPNEPPGPINEEIFWSFKASLMSESPEESRRDQPNNNVSSSSSSNGTPPQPSTSTGNNDKAPAPVEKTISCVSCRKRKLKCDRTKPKCSTCARLRHDCVYPERRRNTGSKRRNMKELEARLAQVETQLISETSKNTPPKNDSQPTPPVGQPDWNNYPLDVNMDFENDPLLDFPVQDSTYTFQPQMPVGVFYSQEVISMGLQEPLPPDLMIEDLHQLYFEKFHSTMPLIHKHRYLAALHLPSHMQPPACLRYAVWTTAASISAEYACYEDVLYERARRYIEQAEMKGFGETFVTLQHAQAWCLIGMYEAKKTYFTRAWMSCGRATRLSHMLGLHRLDGQGQDVKKILPPPKDWIELEERRRTFWAAFYGDRWASSGTGWPMIIQEDTIMTNLPASEESFEQGIMQSTVTLKKALTPEGAPQITPFGGVILSACLFGHNFHHLHQNGSDERPEDLSNGEFWKRHRRMDNILSNTFMFLPDHLRLPQGLRDMNIVFLHLNIHASTICLHQAAVVTAERNKIPSSFIRQSRARSLMAAEEIASIMRLISHLDASNMNSWMGFCLYVASGVFIQDLRGTQKSSQSQTNLEFIVSAMKAIGVRHSITQHFTAQVELDIEGNGLTVDCPSQTVQTPGQVKGSMIGILPPEMHSSFESDAELRAFYLQSQTRAHPVDPKQRPLLGIYMREQPAKPVESNALFEALYGVLPRSGTLAMVDSPEKSSSNGSTYNYLNPSGNDSLSTYDSNLDSRKSSNSGNQTSPPDLNSTFTSASGSIAVPAATVCPFDAQYVRPSADTTDPTSFYNGGIETPLFTDPELQFDMNTDTSTLTNDVRPTQYPYRGADPSNYNDGPYSMFPNSSRTQNSTPITNRPNGPMPSVEQSVCNFITGKLGAAGSLQNADNSTKS